MLKEWRYKKGNAEYERYIHSPAWRNKAECRLEIDGHICQVCGKEASDVHHLTYDRFGHEDMSDLVSLCRDCHDKAEAKRQSAGTRHSGCCVYPQKRYFTSGYDRRAEMEQNSRWCNQADKRTALS